METVWSSVAPINEVDSTEKCQILVRIIEAKQLVGNDIDPLIQVSIGQQVKTTKTKKSVNDAIFEEDFVFEFSSPKIIFLQNIISITAFSDGGLFRQNKSIGCFKIDAATVHAQIGQGFYRKWAMLLDVDDPMSGPKGYVKCDIIATTTGTAKPAPPKPAADEDDIEGNLLVPDDCATSTGERQPAKFIISIFSAEFLPTLNATGMFNVTKAFIGQAPKALVSPYVQVSFAGKSGKTKIIKQDANPEWNQEIIFVELFPALVKTIRIHVRDEGGAVLATTLLNLDAISDVGSSGFLPTFGPAYINLYGNFRSNIEHSRLNYGLGEGIAYRGRLCMAIRVELLEFFPRKGMHKVDVKNCLPMPEEIFGHWQDFSFFGSIFDASMIDRKYLNKSLHFEVTMGEFGSLEDSLANSGDNRLSKGMSKSVESILDSAESSGFSSSLSSSVLSLSTLQFGTKASNSADNIDNANASSDKTIGKNSVATTKDGYCRLDYGCDKPILTLSLSYQYRPRLYKDAIIISRIYKYLAKSVLEIEKMFDMKQKSEIAMLLQTSLDSLSKICKEAINVLSENSTEPLSVQTDLERQKRKQRVEALKKCCQYSCQPFMESNLTETIRELCKIRDQIKFLSIELEECLPDVFLWLCHQSRRIGYKRFRACELLFPNEDVNAGTRLQTFFLKRIPNDETAKPIVAIVTGYFLISSSLENSRIRQGLPAGFSVISDNGAQFLRYEESFDYELRCYLFQARSLIASDDSGLSDPYVKIILKDNVVESQVIEQTLSPVWDETLVLPLVTLYGKPEYYAQNAPKILIQVFDYDRVGKSDFLGQAEAYPVVKMSKEPYCSPKFPAPLASWPLYLNSTEEGGDIMACFELIQIASDMTECPDLPLPKQENSNIIPMPDYIKPVLTAYILEVSFWGLRDLKPAGVLPIEDPSIEIECGGQIIHSGPVITMKKLQNFQCGKQRIKILLPENQLYRPPLNIRCVDKKTFGRSVLIGSCSIANIEQFISKGQEPMESVISTESIIESVPDPAQSVTVSLKNVETLVQQENDNKSDNKLSKKKKISRNSENIKEIQPNISTPLPNGGSSQLPTEGNVKKIPEISASFQSDKKKETQDLFDWWSKYYATRRKCQNESKILSAEDSTCVLIIDETRRKKKRKKEKYLNTKVKAVAKFVKNIQNGPKNLLESSEPKIEAFKIYPCELENVPEFSKFTDRFSQFTLYRGKKSFEEKDESDRIVGKFKGLIKIRRPRHVQQDEGGENPLFRLPNDSVKVLVRVYVVQANNLRPCDPTGKADPYVTVACGNTKISDKQNTIYCQLNPVFGRMFEFEATFPEEYELTVRLFDWDRLTADDLMGETKIDLEQRFYSKHRATCGLQSKYEPKGYNFWRDSLKPTQILTRLCRQFGLTGPFYGHASVTVGTKKFQVPFSEELSADNENLALYALRNWSDMPIIGYHFVPEHVETRTLYLPNKPGMEQGTLEMWIDMFPLDGLPPPPPVDITPRKPISYQLRAIIWDTKEVVLDDYNILTGSSSVDQYIKSFLIGSATDHQQTDVHYRSLNGEGNFNWRFLFNFDYCEAEQKIVYKTKQSSFSLSEHEEKVFPKITFQLWDADIITPDDYLGTLSLDLTKIPLGAKSAKHCTLETLAGKNYPSAFLNGKSNEINLFKVRRTRGWWPFTKLDGAKQLITGKADIEFQILAACEAEKKPAGLGRDAPDPMPAPQRPETSFAWFSSPWKMLKYDVWIGMRWRCFQILLILLFILFFALFIYQLPQSVAEKLVLG